MAAGNLHFKSDIGGITSVRVEAREILNELKGVTN